MYFRLNGLALCCIVTLQSKNSISLHALHIRPLHNERTSVALMETLRAAFHNGHSDRESRRTANLEKIR